MAATEGWHQAKEKQKITRAVKIPGPDPEPVGSVTAKRGRGRGRRRRLILRLFGWGFAGVCVVLAGVIYFGLGRQFDAPEWLRQRVETRIERNLAGMQIEFGQIYMVVNHG